MPVRNRDIAAVLEEIGGLLDILEDNPFRSRAYHNAATTVRDYGPSLGELLENGGELPKLPGIGPDLSAKIHEIVATGEAAMHLRLRKQVPPRLLELLQLPGVGPKRARTLWKELGVTSIDDLLAAKQAGRLQALRGFGPKFEAQLTQALDEGGAFKERKLPLGTVARMADDYTALLKAAPGVSQVTAAGSLRRGLEQLGELDLIVAASEPGPVVQRFLAISDIAEVIASGPTRTAVRLSDGLQVTLHVVPDESYGAALHYFTGSQAHRQAIRRLGQSRGLRVNEHGVFRGRERIAGATEDSVFAALELPFIAPELREGQGEVEAAQHGSLPALVSESDLRGDLHCHTVASDGRGSLEEMVAAAQGRGLSYMAITEHSPSLSIARGLDENRLWARMEEIDALNRQRKGFTILKGAEVDILEDGSLDYPDSMLQRLDIVVASVHSRFAESRAQQTRRILRAMENPYVSILGHPTGRRMPRDAYDLDMEQVVAFAGQSGCILEVNSQPERLDLNDAHCRLAKQNGVLVSINSDAHSTAGLDNVRFGLAQARRAGLSPVDVLNTRPLSKLRTLLAARRP